MSQFRNERPRSFANSRDASPTRIGLRSGVYVLKRNLAGVEYARPSWPDETILRILPGLNSDYQGGQESPFEPCRMPEDQGRYGAWQCCYEAVRKFGDPGITMLISNGDPSYDPYNQNPCWILYRAIKDACDRKQGRAEWYALLQDNPRGKPLDRPCDITLVQALVFRHKGKDCFHQGRPPIGFAPDDPLMVFELSRSAAVALFGALDRRREGWTGNPSDPRAFEYPDITDINGGAFVHLYQEGGGPQQQQAVAPAAPFDPYAPAAPNQRGYAGGGGRGNQRPNARYACHLTATLNGGPPDRDILPGLANHAQRIAAKIRPWDDILWFPTDVEQAHIINRHFPASAIMHAFQDHPDWILPDTRAQAVNAVSRAVPAAPPGAPAYQQPGYPQQQQPAQAGYEQGGYDQGGEPESAYTVYQRYEEAQRAAAAAYQAPAPPTDPYAGYGPPASTVPAYQPPQPPPQAPPPAAQPPQQSATYYQQPPAYQPPPTYPQQPTAYQQPTYQQSAYQPPPAPPPAPAANMTPDYYQTPPPPPRLTPPPAGQVYQPPQQPQFPWGQAAAPAAPGLDAAVPPVPTAPPAPAAMAAVPEGEQANKVLAELEAAWQRAAQRKRIGAVPEPPPAPGAGS